MVQQTTQFSGFQVTLTAHREDQNSLLLASIEVEDSPNAPTPNPVHVALVIDRSGSMSGMQLDITKAAVAQFIRSLGPDDRVAVIAYDDEVQLLSPMAAPSEDLARRVEQLEVGGSTNLYGGWVAGAKMVGKGGRVILLSDGLANGGRFRHAEDLARHAAISYQRFGVTTTTIGVGHGYDEALMSGMARDGGGAHYFAHEMRAITEAFSQERHSLDATILASVSLRFQGVTEQLGHFWGGERKTRVFTIATLAGDPMSMRYTDRQSGAVHTVNLNMPTEFGYSEATRVEHLFQRASEAEYQMIRVRDPRSAQQMREQLRGIVLQLLALPGSDEPHVMATIERLHASMARLEELERNYDEQQAMMHRKRSQQSSYNLRERKKAFSSFEDEQGFLRETMRDQYVALGVQVISVARAAFLLAPLMEWQRWAAIPISVTDTEIRVVMENPRQGFILHEIQERTGRRARADATSMDADAIQRMLLEAGN